MTRALLMRARHIAQLVGELDELRFKHNRLEIEFRVLKERLDGLEGRHDSLSAQTRGRLGGRPARSANGSAGPQTPLPVGVTMFPTKE